MLKNILFDLDGTLTDSQEGVIKCFQYTIMELRQTYCSESELKTLIGVPIRLIFQKLLESDDNHLIDKAIRLYREKFLEIGIIENKIYPGIEDLLITLHRNSCRLWIVTLKNETDAAKVVRHFSFDKLIRGVYGPNMDEYPDSKSRLIETVLADFELVPNETVMVGDREEDIFAGKQNQIMTIGVTYGYGTKEEIANSNPDFTCNNPYEIQQAIMNYKPKS